MRLMNRTKCFLLFAISGHGNSPPPPSPFDEQHSANHLRKSQTPLPPIHSSQFEFEDERYALLLRFCFSAIFLLFSFLHVRKYHHISLYICQFIRLFNHSFIHSFIHSNISFIQIFIYSFIHSFKYSFIQIFIYSFIHSFKHSFIHSLFHPLILLIFTLFCFII